MSILFAASFDHQTTVIATRVAVDLYHSGSNWEHDTRKS